MAGEAKLVQLPQHCLALVIFAQVFLRRVSCRPTCCTWYRKLTASRAMRACISYTSTVNSFFIRCT